MFGWFRRKAPLLAEPSRSTLVPRIKNLQFTAALKGMNIPAEQMPHTEPLAADLLVTYAFDLPGMFQMASVEAIAELGIPLEEVRAIAIANLNRLLRNIRVIDQGPFRQIVTGDELEACMLLVDSFWNQQAAQRNDEIVAIAPSRNAVLFCESRSEEGTFVLQDLAAELFQEEQTHGLSQRLLVWRGGRWEEF